MAAFAATVADWVQESKELCTLIFRRAAELLIEAMLLPRAAGGNMPLKTGFLRASLVVSKDQMPMMRDGAVPVEGATYTPDGQVELVIATAELGETIYAGFVAAYASRLNYGFTGTDALGRNYSQQGYLFVELAAQKWQKIVAEVEADIKARAGR